MTARMVADKDWTTLVETARILAASEPHSWRFLAVGDGPDRPALIECASDLVSAGVLEFPEVARDVLPIVADADIGVLLTDVRVAAEGCSSSITEYMACRLPVVCTACGGNPELVLDGRTGYLVPPSDAPAVAGALRRLRGSSARARSMGDAGRQRQLELFSVRAMVDGYVSAYESARRGGAEARTDR
jgi:glycosyltransferase involved in cell wall biosynthesis